MKTIETTPGHTEAAPEEMAVLRAMANKPPVEGKDFERMPAEEMPDLADDDRVEPVQNQHDEPYANVEVVPVVEQICHDIVETAKVRRAKFQMLVFMVDTNGFMVTCDLCSEKFLNDAADYLRIRLGDKSERGGIIVEASEIQKFLPLKGN